MHPAGAAAAAAQAAGGAFMDVRAAARATIILGLAMAAIALVAATIKPGDFHAHAHAQITEHAAPAPAPAPGAEQCAATGAEVLDLRGNALALVLTGVLQSVMAAGADLALAGSLPMGHLFSATAHLFGAINVYSLCEVVNAAAVVAVGHCARGYLAYLVIGYVLLAVSYALLLGVSMAVTFCW